MQKPNVLFVNLGERSDLETEVRSTLADHFDVSCVGRLDSECSLQRTVSHDFRESPPTTVRPDVIVMWASSEPAVSERAVATLQDRFEDVPIHAILATQNAEAVRELLRRGVADFSVLPLKKTEVLPRLWRLVGRLQENTPLGLTLWKRLGRKQLIGESPVFAAAIEKIPIIAKCDGTVLIEGETGTGKDICARAIHYLSPRTAKPFVPVNCGAIPVELMENELFGHARGAYTGACTTQQGLIHDAEGGTLFLDEIDCLPQIAQVKLLRVLQEKDYRPLGSSRTRAADIRLIAATNTNTEDAVRTGRIRRDFYYRLNVLPVRLPPLRERHEDIVLLAQHFLAKSAAEHNRPVSTLSAAAVHALKGHDWPGNVRELEHVIERAVVFAEGRPVVTVSDLNFPLSESAQPQSFQEAKARAIARFERSYIESLLAVFQGNITRAAEAARKNRRAFWELIRKHQIDARCFRKPGSLVKAD